MQEENRIVSKEKKGQFITLDDISQMKYTAKVWDSLWVKFRANLNIKIC